MNLKRLTNVPFTHTLTLMCLMVVMACSLTQAQTRIRPRRLDFGVIGGLNMSSYAFAPRLNQAQTYSYTAGLAVRYTEENFFGLQAELTLTERGYKDDLDDELKEAGYSYDRMLTYLELPIMAHVYFRMGRRNQVCIDAGPKIGFYLSDKINSNMPKGYDEGTYTRPSGGTVVLNDYRYMHHTLPIEKKFDYGIQFGIGYEFRFSREISAQIMGRYYYGLGNLWPDKKTDHYEGSSNNAIQVTLTLWYHTFIKGKKVKAKE